MKTTTRPALISNCCSVKGYDYEISERCSKCKEHCQYVPEEVAVIQYHDENQVDFLINQEEEFRINERDLDELVLALKQQEECYHFRGDADWFSRYDIENTDYINYIFSNRDKWQPINP